MLPFLTAFLTVLFITPFVIRIAQKNKLVDNPSIRKHPASVHKGIIPRAGGLALVSGVMFSMLLFLPKTPELIAILIGSLLVVAVGIWDDYRHTSPYVRFLLNFVCAGVVVGVGISTPFITNPLGGVIRLDSVSLHFNFLGNHSIVVFSVLFALVWIVWMMNAVGWSAGVDGQFPGFVVISSFVIALLSTRYGIFDISQKIVAALAFITAGSYLGFLFYNFYPQKIMPGYSGKSLAGFLLAILAILSGAKVGTALLVLGVPIVDALFTIIRRIATGKSPFKADSGHLHHELMRLGWGKRRIAIFYWLITALLGIIALTVDSQVKAFAFIIVGTIVIGVLISFRLFNFFRIFT
jgi:UDP-GlcNAc:undecaprenyl-phosphate GlcNAc-1-phosphate transferase